MQLNYSNFDHDYYGFRAAVASRKLCLVAGAVLLLSGTAAAQVQQPVKQVSGGNDVVPIDLTPGGGAGPGKIEHGTLVGSATSAGANQIRSFACAADVNDDGSVGMDDLFDFFVYFDARDARADLIGDANFGFEDLIVFLEAFNEGC